MSAAELRVRVTPRAARNEVAGERDGVLLVRVTAPPEGGKANAATCKVIARALGIAPSRVTVARGAGSRQKSLRVEGVDQRRLKAAPCGLQKPRSDLPYSGLDFFNDHLEGALRRGPPPAAALLHRR